MTSALDQSLISACTKGDIALAEQLVAQGANVNVTDAQSALVWAVANGHTDCARWLIARGADVNLQHGNTANPLHCAGFYGRLDCARLLLEAGADRKAVYEGSKTAALAAREQKHPEVADFIERHPGRVPDQVSFSWRLDNRWLQEVYDFAHRERVTLLRTSEGGPVETMQRESFAALAGEASLRRAFAEHRLRGGTTPEEEPGLSLPGKARVLKREGP
jgi:hypothetical protein